MEKTNYLFGLGARGAKTDMAATKREALPEREFSRLEEIAHSVTHGIGAVLSILGLILLILKASASDTMALIGASVFGAALIILYSASFSYHTSCAVYGSVRPSRIRDICMKCDHSLIYILILGTYAPACLSAMRGAVG